MRDVSLAELPPPPLPPPPPADFGESAIGNSAWRAWTAPAALLIVLVVAMIASIVLSGILLATGGKADDSPTWMTLVSTVIQDGAFIGVPIYFAMLAGRLRTSDFGFRTTRFWPALGWVALAWVSTVIALAIVSSLIGYNETDKLPQELGADKDTFSLVAVGLMVCVMAPIAEEVFFRGYFFPSVSNRLGIAAGVAITGVTFGAIHVVSYLDRPVEAAIVALPYLMVLGAALCLIYWRTKSLIPCILLHSLNNAGAFSVSREWDAWQVLAAVAVTNLICAAITIPLARRSSEQHAVSA